MRNGTRKIFKVGDRVSFRCLIKAGPPEIAQFGQQTGTITKAQEAGDLGARAMDCRPCDIIYWVSTGDTLYPKFACELSEVCDVREK